MLPKSSKAAHRVRRVCVYTAGLSDLREGLVWVRGDAISTGACQDNNQSRPVGYTRRSVSRYSLSLPPPSPTMQAVVQFNNMVRRGISLD